jgi:hypothetical protein
MPWCYDDAFRRVHVLFSAPEWARERGQHFDADRFIESLKDANVNCIQMYAKDHWGYCYYNATEGIRFPIDILGTVVPKAHAEGIKVLAYFSLGWDEYALGRHPDWRAIDQQGLARRYRKLFAWACLNTPYREYALRQVEEIAANYEVDGFWVDIIPIVTDGNTIGWNWSPEYAFDAAQYPVPCYCLSCRRKFRQQFGRDIPIDPTEDDRITGYQFLLDAAATFLQDFREVLQTHRPDAIVTYNGGGSPEDAINVADANCAEGNAPAHSFQSFSCRWAMSHGKPYEIIVSSGLPNSVQSAWAVPQPINYDHWTQKPSELLQLETSIAGAHRGNATITLMPFADGTVEQGQCPAFRTAFERIERMEPYLKGVQKVADVALVLTTEPYLAPHRWADMMQGALNFHEALLQGHFQFDIVEARLVPDYARYPVVVLANQLTMSMAEAERIRAYVEGGGRLIVVGATSLYDENGHIREDFELADVMGVHYQGKIEDRFGYIRVRDSQLSKGVPDVPILTNRSPLSLIAQEGDILGWVERPETLRTEATAMIWGNPAPDRTQSHPLIIRHEFGQGRSVTVGVPLDTGGAVGTWPRQLAINMVDSLLGERSLTTDAPPGVEVVWNRQDRRSILHLLNHQAGDPDRLSTESNRLLLRGITVRLSLEELGAFGSVRVLDSAVHDITHRSVEGWLEIEVPPLAVHTAVVIE